MISYFGIKVTDNMVTENLVFISGKLSVNVGSKREKMKMVLLSLWVKSLSSVV